MAENPQQPASPSETLSKASLWLGLASSILVFGIGFCTIVNASIGLIDLVGIPALICGGSSAFLGLIAIVLGVAGAFSEKASRTIAIVGAVTGMLGMCLFVIFLSASGG